MDWAHKREWTVIVVLASCAIAVLAIIGFSIFYKTPTCFDHTQNGDERGVDCGGSCSTVCSADLNKASVRFARALEQSGRSDLIAYIDNTNPGAYAERAEVLIDVYRQDGHMIEKRFSIPLPAKSTTPLFIPGISNGLVQQAFVAFASGSPVWTRGTGGAEAMPMASNLSVSGTGDKPRVTVSVTNPTAYPEREVPFVASVFAADGTVIAASQTIVPLIPPQGSSQAVFTWNEPFAQPYARIEILPLLKLPSLLP